MNLAFVCAGDINIPPKSWGAVEILVWEYYQRLMSKGHKVDIYNIKDIQWVKKELESSYYDFVHLQHEDLLPMLEDVQVNKMAITAHCGWAADYTNYYPYYWKTFKHIINTKHFLFALSEEIKNNYINFGIKKNKIFITKNGVDTKKYNKINYPLFDNRSIFLGKIEHRKRQYLLSDKELNIDFVGFGDELKLSSTNRMVGLWSKEKIYSDLTNYSNLVLLSISEAHPLVCMEALAAGCGLVLSEKACANLDLSKKFISVIPENKLYDKNYLSEIIEENRKYSNKNREEIIEYSKLFDWDNVVDSYENLVKEII